ncbi:GH13909 [Drosophila grimshawi]|uniref:GH13909 n=1 Tax=Drosophila grimshawi TaxID=7222 RepID=B4K0A2_DROGR|nr:GH13909 [Drosophila grimshawi]
MSDEALKKSSNQLRAACFVQDRFWRRYWKLPKVDGIFIEAQESAQNDICRYQALESMDDEKHEKLNNEQKMDDKDVRDEEPQSANPTADAEEAAAAAEPMEVDYAKLVEVTKQEPAKPTPQACGWRLVRFGLTTPKTS